MIVSTGLQLAMVIAGHYSPAIAQLFPIAGTGIGGIAGVLAALGGQQRAGTAAKNGVLAGGVGGLIGTIVSYFLGDIPAFTIGVGTGAAGVAGAFGALAGRLIGRRAPG
jgi:hypothetical protein